MSVSLDLGCYSGQRTSLVGILVMPVKKRYIGQDPVHSRQFLRWFYPKRGLPIFVPEAIEFLGKEQLSITVLQVTLDFLARAAIDKKETL